MKTSPGIRPFHFLMACLLALLCLSGCGGGGSTGSPDTGAPSTPAPPAPEPPDPQPDTPYGLTRRPVLGNLNLPRAPGGTPGAIGIVPAFPDLPAFSQPVYLTHSGDNSNRLFVVEQAGVIRVFANRPDVSTSKVFLDIRDRVTDGGERGLLGLAFAPDYASSGLFYVYYTDNSSCGGSQLCSVLARYRVSADPDVADPASATSVMTVPQPRDNHNGGTILFGPDGYLYWGLGDGGGGGDPDGHGQNRDSLLGKLLRIDVSSLPYRIPADNPFSASTDNTRDEIWALGLRNPYRFSFDRETRRLWLADVGQNAMEEIDVIEKGGNYGWKWYEGTRVNQSGAPTGCCKAPIHTYLHADNNGSASITGGHVYRGSAVPALRGRYLYADFLTSRVWALSVNDQLQETGNQLIGTAEENVSGFGEDQQGEVYIVGYGGYLYRFSGGVTDDPLAGFPEWLSQTGLFSNTPALIPATGLIPYSVASPLWTDYSTKRRWIAIPDGQQIGFRAEGSWDFPVGTVLVKHFGMERVADDPDSEDPLETRVLILQTGGWVGVTYQWNDEGTDARLLRERASETLTVADARFPDNQRVQTYTYPGPDDCLRCHTQAAGRVLGPRTRQLNSDQDYAGVTDNQLRSWNHIGLFRSDIGPAGQYAAHLGLDDDGASLEARSRAWLDSNCGYCHIPGGPVPGNLNLDSRVPLAGMNALDVLPGSGDLGIADARLIAPGDPARSVLLARIHSTGTGRMPPLGRALSDPQAVEIITRWIDSL